MSALVMVCKSDRVELLSDAALYDPITGAVGAIHSKLASLPELNCVRSGRGPIPVMWITAYVAGLSSTTFDDVVANFDAIRAAAAAYNNGDIPAEEWAQSDIGLIGWSESRDRPEGYMSLGNRVTGASSRTAASRKAARSATTSNPMPMSRSTPSA